MSTASSAATKLASNYYKDRDGEKYFAWQKKVGEFGGWANRTKFETYIRPSDTVLDFGCGGGFLLRALNCAHRIGVEPAPKAAEMAKLNGIEVFTRADDVPDASVDLIISNHALEHTLVPLTELKTLWKKLKPGGKMVFVVPCEAIGYRYKPNDINHHLHSWSPMCLGNIMTEAGFTIIESKPYIHKWPPFYRYVAKLGGRLGFDVACWIYGRLERTWFQVRAVVAKPM